MVFTHHLSSSFDSLKITLCFSVKKEKWNDSKDKYNTSSLLECWDQLELQIRELFCHSSEDAVYFVWIINR